MPPLFELHDVSFDYDGIAALRGLSLDISRGERLVLLGRQWLRQIHPAAAARCTLLPFEGLHQF